MPKTIRDDLTAFSARTYDFAVSKMSLMADQPFGQIDNVMKESRLFPPPEEFAAQARIASMQQYEKLWKEAAGDLEGFREKGSEKGSVLYSWNGTVFLSDQRGQFGSLIANLLAVF